MERRDWRTHLMPAAERALRFLEQLPDRHVAPRATAAELLTRLDRPVPEGPTDPGEVLASLADTVEPGITSMPSGRFFGWVIGGGLPAAIGADWLTSVWDQCAGSAEGTPAAAAVEEVALRWVAELLGLPADASGALVTGAQMANTVCLAAARGAVLDAVGWDVEVRGLVGAPWVHVVVGAERHDCIPRSLRLLGFGAETAHVVPADREGRMRADAFTELAARLEGPMIVCTQAGNVNTGAFDPIAEVAAVARRRRAGGPGSATWVHVDGAFGLWVRASRAKRALAEGVEAADSWATDGHKWPNIPYDSGVALVADRAAHQRAMGIQAAYLPTSSAAGPRSPFDWTPELSRRARGFALYAGLAELGVSGMEALVDRCCRHATRFGEELGAVSGVSIENEIVANQVLVRFSKGAGDVLEDDAHTREVVQRVLRGGVCFASPTSYRGRAAMRISVSNAFTDEEDVRRSIAAITEAHRGG